MTSDFELSPEHEQFRRSVRDFAEAEIAPYAAQWHREHHFPTDVVQKMGALGLMGLIAPEEFGGAGMASEGGGFTSLCLAIEEIGRVDQAPWVWASTRSSPLALTSRRRAGCPTWSPATRSRASGSPSRVPAPTPARRRSRAALLSADADSVCGAAYGVRDEARTNRRNGYRHRELDTRIGTLDVAVPKLREGSYFPEWLLERRRRDEAALTSAVATCYLLGVSTRRMDRLVQSLGITGLEVAGLGDGA